MTSAAAEQEVKNSRRGISRLKLWVAVALVFAAQVVVAFLLGNPPPVKEFHPVPVPVVHMAPSSSQDLLAVMDPTLLIQPHRDNFSGEAWLKMAPRTFTPTNWTEPARPLDLAQEQLGSAFVAFMQTNLPARFQPRIESGLNTESGDVTPMQPISVPSRLRVEGDLARRQLLTPLHLPPQTNADILTNTVVQMVVDAQGYPFSAVIPTGSGSGSGDADQMALTNFSKSIRFAPLDEGELGTVSPDKMTSGRLIFEWQTVPPAPTNAPTTTP
jgi:hypothetical protein